MSKEVEGGGGRGGGRGGREGGRGGGRERKEIRKGGFTLLLHLLSSFHHLLLLHFVIFLYQ